MSFAILIDAGFLKRKLGSPSNPANSSHIAQFVNKITSRPELSDCNLHRIYYYDAPPLKVKKTKPLLGGQIDFSKNPLVATNEAILKSLAKEDYFALRLGEIHFRGWTIDGDFLKKKNQHKDATITEKEIVPSIEQKGVDMRIGLDIASLALKKLTKIIVLVSGDSDFIPAMKFARREGLQVLLVTLGHSVLPEMYEHADIVIESL